MMRMARLIFACALLYVCSAAQAVEQAPLWEAGVGVAALAIPAYRGSATVHHFAMPVPHFTYHGEVLKADRHGLRGQLFDSEYVELDISTAASPPTQSDDIAAREDMPDLEPTVEIGPQLDITLWRASHRHALLKLRLPLRQAFIVNSQPRDIGTLFSPNLNADIQNPFGLSGWNLGLVTGPIYASQRQHAYFYDVQPRYATTTRPAYRSNGGYGGWQFLISISKRFDDMWFGAFVREDTLQGAVFDDSPLIERRHYTAAGFAVTWILGRSTTMVEVDSD